MDCCDSPGLMPLNKALDSLLATLSCQQSTQTIPLDESDGHILAEDILAPLAIPPFANSAMDGYAIAFDSLHSSQWIPVIGEALAGHPYPTTCPANGAIRIMTGATLPDGTDTILIQEEVERTDTAIRFTGQAILGQHVRHAGQDLSLGEKVLEQGERLSPRQMQLLASLGLEQVPVYQPLRVALLSSGDELKPLGAILQAGEIFDSNRHGLKALLNRLHVECLDLGIIGDDKPKLREAFTTACHDADVVICSGGVSVGDADYTRQIIEELGEIHFWKLALKPGKPFSFGQLPGAWFFGLPGNPVSAIASFCQLVRPALIKLSGAKDTPPMRLKATTSHPLHKIPGRTDFQRGIYHVDSEGNPIVMPTGVQCSGVFRSFSLANCFIVLEQERSQVVAGESVIIEPFDWVLQ